jgi:O-antigen/teichoic acid export membrane protein
VFGETSEVLASRCNDWKRLTSPWRSTIYTNSLYLMAANVVSATFGFLFWTAAARLYYPQEVGVAAAAISAAGLLAMLSMLGLDYAMVRYLPRATDPHTIIGSSLTIGVISALALSLTFIAGLRVWSPALLPLQPSPLFVAGFVIATVFLTVSGLLGSIFLARKRASLVCLQSSVFSVTKVLFVIILSAIPHAMGLIGAWALGLVAAVGCGILLFLPRVEDGRYTLHPMLRREAINDMTHFAFANYLATVLWSAPTFLLPLLVINTLGAESNAYFYVASSVSGLLAMIPTAVSLSLFAHGSHDEGQLVRDTVECGRFTIWLLVPAIGAIFLLGGRVLLLFGQPYSQQATRLLWILALSTLPMTVNFLFFSVSRVQQRMAGVVACTAWILGITMGLSAVLLPRMGLLGAGTAWLAAQASAAIAILTCYGLRRAPLTYVDNTLIHK